MLYLLWLVQRILSQYHACSHILYWNSSLMSHCVLPSGSSILQKKTQLSVHIFITSTQNQHGYEIDPSLSSMLVTSHCLTVRSLATYTECPRRNVRDFGRVFLMLNYTDITQNTYIQTWTVTEIMAREFWNFDSCYTLTDYQIHIETGRNMWFL